MNLPNDIARCNGVQYAEGDWREGCEKCLRRIAPSGDRVVMMEPPAIITFWCEFLIEE
jgi:hypothetical protein